ncbi:response regulator [Klebsiella oxytoca]|uniref:response regulator n=1 Tax=Klebsiella oxytoca TaxID=571 RepID=UPI00292F3760|nr:response regulator [Klebsiella oxytoca]
MNILIIEDNVLKRSEIEQVINEELHNNNNNPTYSYADNLVFARRQLQTQVYDLIIFDMYLPLANNHFDEVDCSEELISEFSVSKNYQAEAIALTQFEISEIENFQSFNSAGITVVHFNENKNWVAALRQKITRASQKNKV